MDVGDCGLVNVGFFIDLNLICSVANCDVRGFFQMKNIPQKNRANLPRTKEINGPAEVSR